MHMGRDLNIIQPVIFSNTFALSKFWYTAAIFPTTNQLIAKIISIVEILIWKGHPIRVGIQQIILPVNRGGLNLMYPGINKAKTLFITNFLTHSTNNPFIMQFLSTNNPSFLHSMPNVSYVKYFLLEIRYISLMNRSQFL
jgi:hypothetical protein